MNKMPNTSVIDFVEDLFSEEKIKSGQHPVGPTIKEDDKNLMAQKVSPDFVGAIVEGKNPVLEAAIPEEKKKIQEV